ncbi:cytochrome C peroxidase [Burkholderia pseudomallei]|uniref:cytochrome C peroxidase n=1 Tax=Burkholderia pseudomallei TaxID=28450 RepID=UPI0021172B48|nr:cytochrome C peroxidase [Burkholderia pseudomallei]
MGEAFRAIGDKSHVENSPRCLLINSKDGHCFIPLSESAGSLRWHANFAALRPIFAPVSHRWDASGIMGNTDYRFSAVCAFCIF